MKLKLDSQDDIKILTVTGELSSQHAAILKVGLRKMFQTGLPRFVLDLSSTGPTTPEALASVATGARDDAAKAGVRILVVSTHAPIADAPSASAAVAKLSGAGTAEAPSPGGDPLEEEAQLQAQLRKLQRRKAALEQHLAKAGDQDVRVLKKENSDLRREVSRLERLVTGLSVRRKEVAFLSSSERKRARVSEILSAVLEQEGVLPIK